MAFDGITIANVVKEMNDTIIGCRINKIAQPENDELILTIKGSCGQKRLFISADASLPLIYFTENNKPSPMTAPGFCMLLRKHLQNGRIVAVTQPGVQTLSGYQAVAYCRIRAVGNDFGRTERQRKVLQAVLDKAKTLSPAQLNDIADDVFPMVATSLELSEILDLIGNVSTYEIVGTTGFPFDSNISTGKIGSKGSCVIPMDLTTNVELLHEYLYPEIEYTPSPEVLEYSEIIEQHTSPYVGTMSEDEELN